MLKHLFIEINIKKKINKIKIKIDKSID